MWRSLPFISSIFRSSSLSVAVIIFPVPSIKTLMDGLARHFFQCGHAFHDLHQSAAPQGKHAALNSFLLEFNRRRTHKNQFPDLIVNFHYLIKTTASLVTRAVTNG